jgi:hypothetical protein
LLWWTIYGFGTCLLLIMFFFSLYVSKSHPLSKDEILVLNSYVCSTKVCSCCDELFMDLPCFCIWPCFVFFFVFLNHLHCLMMKFWFWIQMYVQLKTFFFCVNEPWQILGACSNVIGCLKGVATILISQLKKNVFLLIIFQLMWWVILHLM